MAESVSLADVTHATFEPLVGQRFVVRWPDVTEELVLSNVKMSPTDGDPRRKRLPFSLFFKGTTPNLVLNQQMHPMAHEGLGTLEIFIVPIGQDPDNGTILYQAAFS